MYRSVLVPLDGSQLAEQALPLAAHIAQAAGARVHLVHVSTPAAVIFVEGLPVIDDELRSLRREHEQAYLADIQARLLDQHRVQADTAVLSGDVAPALAQYIGRHDIDLVVMTTHGHGGLAAFWLGSVAEGLLRLARIPLLLVRPPADEEAAPADVGLPTRMLICLDGSPASEVVLSPALDLGRLLGLHITLLRAVAPAEKGEAPMVGRWRQDEADADRVYADAVEYLDQRAQPLRVQGVAVDSLILIDASPARAVLETARAEPGALIALATHGRGTFERLLMGSVADKIVRGARVPVLLIRSSHPQAAAGTTSGDRLTTG